jgi:hypothetical protein
MAETAQVPSEAVPPLARSTQVDRHAQPASKLEPEPEPEHAQDTEADAGLLLGMEQHLSPLTTRPLVVEGSVSERQTSVTWLVSLPTDASATARFELQYGAPKVGRWHTLEKKDLATEEVLTEGQIAFPSATGVVPAKKFQAAVWVPGDGPYVLRVRARYGNGSWSKWSPKSDIVTRMSVQSPSTEGQGQDNPDLPLSAPEGPIDAAAVDEESSRELSRASLTQEESVSGYIQVAVTGYESRGTGKEQHIVWLLRVTRVDRDGEHRHEVVGRRYSGIHQFNEYLRKTPCTPAALRAAGGKWAKKLPRG